MSNIHFIGGEKGGVGKSVVARILAQYFIDNDIPFLGFDSDKSHGALLRFYTGFASPVVVDKFESLDSVIEAAEANPGRRILVDLAAQTHQSLVRWIDDSGLLELVDELGFTLTYWHVLDAGRDSVDLLRKLLDQFGGRLDLVLVLNEIRGDNFDILEASGERDRALELGANIISLRHLPDATMQKIDNHSSSFWAATSADRVGTGLGLMERQRVKTWLRRAYDELDALVV
jgi:hypothetical protein